MGMQAPAHNAHEAQAAHAQAEVVRLRESVVQSVGAAEKKWMEFFDNPNAYWDNRQNKRNPRAPDFKHKDEKDTVLWLDSRDTPSCASSTYTYFCSARHMRRVEYDAVYFVH